MYLFAFMKKKERYNYLINHEIVMIKPTSKNSKSQRELKIVLKSTF